ncbi:phospholipase D-like domain-containing protein [Phyllobacterium sp. 0TCS1.6C]|uniref:phospholipase D-like domain-containing protein n=1 Tax=unclassified Phyllobacterium TaxID=2638441 RepID=UPI00226456C6|nr:MULTISPECIES: phospholipase D-like domain-containing protein [unclassified Phyllobacterium]MCX8282133.1 phospholipase D-like domain-containing protein [Phyllobacterium sp. 0TCS1.6C]MCX8296341.1 phospholipase D-like domain-containing protein [Phyllobacterium sp. 0TCS1.6A]
MDISVARIGSKKSRALSRIIVPGVNAWRREHARRVSMLVDAAEYYGWLERALAKARRSIFIIGWDFNGRIHLRPDQARSPQLGPYLRRLAEERPDLHIHVLIWSAGPIYSAGQMRFFPHETWAEHPRIRFCYDRSHPLRGCHHQKIVCIDDRMAFCGGIDLTIERWDTQLHTIDDPRRTDPSGKAYPPVHDVQIAVDGDAANALADLARARWKTCTGEELQAVRSDGEVWPRGLKADMREVEVAIARTLPATFSRRGVREIERLNEAAIAAAARCVYVETQYFTCRRLGRLLAQRLAEPDGPEIVVLTPKECHGTFEAMFMGGNGRRLISRLKQADKFNRLRVLYSAVASGDEPETDIFLHSKVMIVDDRYIRVGSSNLNNRSRGMDTECDVAVEAVEPQTRAAIRRLRARLLAEHLGMEASAVMTACEKAGSLLPLVDSRVTGRRRLKPIQAGNEAENEVLLTSVFDPSKAMAPMRWAMRAVRALRRRLRRSGG